MLASCSAAFGPGEFTAILGPNGAGKSTFLRCLAGLVTPSAGTVTLRGEPIFSLSAERRASTLTFLPQREDIPTGFTVAEVVGFGARESDPAAVTAAMTRLGLASLARRRIETLSEGQRQRVSLARAMVQTRAVNGAGGLVVLADEPASALDPALAMDALALFRELARGGSESGGAGEGGGGGGGGGGGRAVVAVLHDLNLALRFADRAILLDRSGVLIADGPAQATITPANLERLFGLPWRLLPSPDGTVAVVPLMIPPSRNPTMA